MQNYNLTVFDCYMIMGFVYIIFFVHTSQFNSSVIFEQA